MTTHERNDSDKTERPFREWIRAHAGLDSVREYLSVQNNDLWIHRYSERRETKRMTVGQVIDQLALVEIKSFDAELPFAQRDTLGVVDDILRLATTKNDRRRALKIRDRRRPGCYRIVRWLGLHTLQMSADRPDTSERMVWDGKTIVSEGRLVELLRFDFDLDHPTRPLDTRRHHRRPSREQHPDLFVIKNGK